mmetsp:Transcript_14786/g.30484  ORF Transcript_14786/g.30484 Transcript_14786/m.30484 type:complete len:176 (-) Transcript_14786:13-540(-)
MKSQQRFGEWHKDVSQWLRNTPNANTYIRTKNTPTNHTTGFFLCKYHGGKNRFPPNLSTEVLKADFNHTLLAQTKEQQAVIIGWHSPLASLWFFWIYDTMMEEMHYPKSCLEWMEQRSQVQQMPTTTILIPLSSCSYSVLIDTFHHGGTFSRSLAYFFVVLATQDFTTLECISVF